MPINRIDGPNSVPLAVGDYQAQNNQLLALGRMGDVIPFSGSTMTEGYVFQVGGTLYEVVGSVSITGTVSPYVKITPAGATASAAFVANLSGVTWNAAYMGMYDVSGNRYLLGYGSHGIKIYQGNATDIWVCPPSVNSILINAVGAGGNGAQCVVGVRGGGGGGSGAWCRNLVVNVTPGGIYTITLTKTSDSSFVGPGVNLQLGKGGNASGATGGSGGIGSGGASNGYAGGNGMTTSTYQGGGGGGIGGAGANGGATVGDGAGGGSGRPASTKYPGIGGGGPYFVGEGGVCVAASVFTRSNGGPGAGAGANIGVGGAPGGIGGGGSGVSGQTAEFAIGFGGDPFMAIEW